MAPDELLNAIASAPSLREFVEANLLSRVPWIFQGDEALFDKWRKAVAREATMNAQDVYLVGSAATGYSLSPLKPGRDFRHAVSGATYRPSDLDIAIVDSSFFEKAWNTILSFDRAGGLGRFLRNEHKYPWAEVGSEIEQMRKNVYWGSISYVHASSGTSIARVLRSLFAATTRSKPFIGHVAKARIYRRREDLLSYHEQSLQSVKEILGRRGA